MEARIHTVEVAPNTGSDPQPVGMADLQPLGVQPPHLSFPCSAACTLSPLRPLATACLPVLHQVLRNHPLLFTMLPTSLTPGTPASLGHLPCLLATTPWTVAPPTQEELIFTAHVLCVSCVSSHSTEAPPPQGVPCSHPHLHRGRQQHREIECLLRPLRHSEGPPEGRVCVLFLLCWPPPCSP